jgi:hypothetical protein
MEGEASWTISKEEEESLAKELQEWSNSLLPSLPNSIEFGEEDEDDNEWDEDDAAWAHEMGDMPVQTSASGAKKLQPVPDNKFSNRISLEPLHDTFTAPEAAVGQLKEQQKKTAAGVSPIIHSQHLDHSPLPSWRTEIA